MPSFTNLLIVMAVAFTAPLLLGLFPRLLLPSVVLEIVAGIVVGPSVLGWVEVDEAVEVIALLGLAFVLFLAGLEIEFEKLRGRVLRLTLLGFAISFAVALVVSLGLSAADLVDTPLLVAIILCSTSLGVLVPVLKDSGQLATTFGQLIIAAASIADFGAIILLSIFFSGEGGTGSTLLLLGDRREPDQQHHRPAHPDLGGRVLEPQQVVADPLRPFRPTHREENRGRQCEQATDQDERRPGAALAREQDREQDDRPEVGDRSGSHHELAERRRDLAGVLEHGDDHPERRRREDHGDEERGLGEATRLQRQAGDDSDPEGQQPAAARHAQQTPAELVELDLETGEEEQEDEPDRREHGDRLVDLDPPEPGRPDRDPRRDLEHDGGQPHAWEEAEQEGRRKRHGHDQQQAGERGLVHAPSVGRGREALRRH